jgi:ABC-type oligopeptide transport system substrate-binding subunit
VDRRVRLYDRRCERDPERARAHQGGWQAVGHGNFSGHSDPEIDRAIEASGTIEEPKARQEALDRVMRTVVSRRIMIPLYLAQLSYAVDRDLSWTPRHDNLIQASEIRPAR